VGALVAQAARDRLADAASPTCNQSDLVGETGHDTGFPPLTSMTEPQM